MNDPHQTAVTTEDTVVDAAQVPGNLRLQGSKESVKLSRGMSSSYHLELTLPMSTKKLPSTSRAQSLVPENSEWE